MKNNDYLNNIIMDLTDVLWEEHGTGAQYRTTLVGTKYFKNKYGTKLIKENWQDTLHAVVDVLKDEGIINDATYDKQDFVLTIKFNSCVHLETEKQLVENGINIISCPCSNVVMYFIDKVVGKHSELVKVTIENNECVATICIMGSTSA
ncbi:MAG TPA: hypothetical protein GXZ27_12620 [Thermoanaerobacterales bacterium]|jgi:hypothetical protein|nr:hypothetical protein [Thermoanaerobacterales bacterium]